MALTRITKGVIKPNENYDTHNINSTGIVTAIGLDVNGNGDISGNLNVGGVLTYEDVTSIDSVGIITAQKDIHVGAGVSAVGVGTFGSLDISGDVDVDGHTNLDNVSIAGVTTFASSIQVADSIIHEGDTDTKIDLANNQLKLTAGNRLRVDLSANHFNYFYGTNLSEATSTYPKAGSATYVHRFRDTSGDDTIIHFHNTNVKNTVFEWNAYGNTSAAGNLIFRDLNTGKTEYARFTGTGSFNIAKDLDVDGHTNLDNVSIAGVATATTFVGALTGTASGNPTLSNGADNRIITATGANTLTGESNLTWTGSYFETNGSAETWTMRARSGGPSSKIGFQNQYLANGYTIGCGAANQSFVVYTGGPTNDRLRIDSTGITTFSQNLFASKDFDVDGHTNLDNVSIAGVTTFSGNLDANGVVYVRQNASPTIYLTSNSTTGSGRIFFGDPDSDLVGRLSYVHNGDYFNFYASYGERFRIAGNGDITVTSIDNFGLGPTLKLFHNSGSPAANDVVSRISMFGDDAAGNETEYGRIETVIDSTTDSQETGHINFGTRGLGSFANVFRIKRRSTGSAPSYTTDDADGIILDVYNTGNPYPRYMNFIAKSAGNTDSNIAFWTEAVGGSPTEKLRINSSGNVSIYNDLDVDGHTNLDNVSIAGITTFSDRAYLTNDLTITGTAPRVIFTDTNNNSDYRINVDAGNFEVQDVTNSYATRLRITSSGTAVFGGNTAAPIVDNGELYYRGNSTSTFQNLPQNFYLYSDDKAYNATNPGAGLLFGGIYTSSGQYTTFAGIHGIKENNTDNNYNSALVFGTRQQGSSTWERLRIDSSGKLTLGTTTPSSNSAAYMFTVADPTNSLGNCGITIRAGTGGGSNTNQGSIFYSNATSGTGEYAGYLQYNHNDNWFRIGTNSAERFRIDSNGVMAYGPFASFAYNNLTGLFCVHSGARVNTGGANQFAAAKGGFVDNSRFELENKLITVGGYQQIIQAHNGAQLKISNSRNNWSYYNNLPNYLLGHPATDAINISNYSVTFRATMTVFLQRSNGWNSVPLTGWELLESNTNIYPGSTDSRLYVKTFAAGSYTFDSDSAMYFFVL